jgi:predicted enzyme related to lactoylglutathione lyase
MPGDPPGEYYVARLRGRDVAGVGSVPPGAADAEAVWNTYVAVDDADAAAERVIAAGGTVLVPPLDAPPAGRLFVFTDPAGAVLFGWEAAARRGAQLVNEPSAWSMSLLTTPDPDGAKAFYGQVFGWETETFDAGGADVTLWRRPGYVGGEPHQPVPRDVVATMVASQERPAGWSVDCWVGDADAFVAKATEAGGAVIAGPIDAPPFRSVVVADPEGAAFSVSQLTAQT